MSFVRQSYPGSAFPPGESSRRHGGWTLLAGRRASPSPAPQLNPHEFPGQRIYRGRGNYHREHRPKNRGKCSCALPHCSPSILLYPHESTWILVYPYLSSLIPLYPQLSTWIPFYPCLLLEIPFCPSCGMVSRFESSSVRAPCSTIRVVSGISSETSWPMSYTAFWPGILDLRSSMPDSILSEVCSRLWIAASGYKFPGIPSRSATTSRSIAMFCKSRFCSFFSGNSRENIFKCSASGSPIMNETNS